MDKIIEMFFDPQRWQYALEKGVDKDINKAQLYELTKKETRVRMYQQIKEGKYEIAPPHTALIPKDTPGEFRMVYINEPPDRIFTSISNDLLFDLTSEMVHPRCKSYLRGVGCGKIVQELSSKICQTKGECIGWKSDLSKYFDSVPINYIDRAFDMVEQKHGHSAVIDVLRKYYHNDYYFDPQGNLVKGYQSLKQGCSVASWLADVILYDIDEEISKLDCYYIRYSDDMCCIGKDYKKAMDILTQELAEMGMKLNPKKVEYLTHTTWFKFLGYSIKGADISLSGTRIKKFQKEIEQRTIKNRKTTVKKAVNAVNRYLYKGFDGHSWATQILPVCNVKKDIDELNKFVMDCIRAVATGKRRIGGLGYVKTQAVGCISRGKGRNVKANRLKTGDTIDGYISIGCMYNAIRTRRGVYEALVNTL